MKDNSSNLILREGQSATFIKESNELESTTTNNKNAIAWQNQQLQFNNQPLKDVIFDLERYFNADINLLNEKLGNCPFTSNYKNADLNVVLESIAAVFDLQLIERGSYSYEMLGGRCD